MYKYVLFGLVLLLPLVPAVVVAPPVVYWVTLSISTFVANMLVTMFMSAAAKGLATKTLFGKRMGNLLGFVFSMISKFAVAMVASLVALVVIAPITTTEIIIASLLSFALFFVLYLLVSYREFRVSEKKQKILASIAIFGLLVGGLTFVSTYFALDKQVIVGEVGKPASTSGAQSPAPDDVAYADAAPAEFEKTMGDASKEEAKVSQTVYLIPTSDGTCTVEHSGQVFEFQPRLECVGGEGFSEQRVYCPIQVTVIGDYKTGGSCS